MLIVTNSVFANNTDGAMSTEILWMTNTQFSVAVLIYGRFIIYNMEAPNLLNNQIALSITKNNKARESRSRKCCSWIMQFLLQLMLLFYKTMASPSTKFFKSPFVILDNLGYDKHFAKK